MKHKVLYSCISHKGRCRSINQDNFICCGTYISDDNNKITYPIKGCIEQNIPVIMGVFDGMGGEEHGEIASLLAAETAAKTELAEKPVVVLLNLCKEANEKICHYADEHNITSMGTTAALLLFTEDKIALCNIGDSKIFRYSDRKQEQISVDHLGVSAHGTKPPLSQNLGIPPTEMSIEPYVALGEYNEGDIYLICSDGLTDMLSEKEIQDIVCGNDFDKAAEKLLESALEKGGKDNVTIIICKIIKERTSLFKKLNHGRSVKRIKCE